MEAAMVAVAAVVAVGLVAGAVVVLRRRRSSDEDSHYDPMFFLGITFTGAGVALAASTGRAAYGLMGFGLILMMAGAVRMRRSGHR